MKTASLFLTKLRSSRIAFVIIGLFACYNFSASAQEHPEHPTDKTEKKQLNVDEFADAVNQYITTESRVHDGYFLVTDKKLNTILKLKLQKIHRDRLSALGNDTYFVCADFKGEDNKIYDIDIMMKGASKDGLKATEVTVHKVNGEPRYTWYEEKGVWKKKEK